MAHDGDERGREQAETQERNKWLARLKQLLQNLGARTSRTLEEGTEGLRSVRLLVGGRRASTLRARIRCWEQYQAWLRDTHGIGIQSDPYHIIDYLNTRAAEPCTKSVIRGIADMIKFSEGVMGMYPTERLSDHPLVMSAVNELTAELQRAGPNRRGGQAPRPPVRLLILLERLVTDSKGDPYDRLLATWCLLSSWAMLRFDDHRGLAPKSLVKDGNGWRFSLSRSKTTGPDKRVETRPGVLDDDCYVDEASWMKMGMDLWQEAAPYDRDFFLCAPSPVGGCRCRELTYSEFTGRMRGLIARLEDDHGEKLGPHVAMFWTPHSFRAFLPSAAAAINIESSELSWLAGWCAKSVETYVHTSVVKTSAIQRRVADVARGRLGREDPLGETDLLKELAKFLAERGLGAESVDMAVAALTSYEQQAWKGEQYSIEGSPRTTAPPQDAGGSSSSSGSSGYVGYFVSVSSKRGIRRLHTTGGCGRRPGQEVLHFELLGEETPSPDRYDDFCRQCWRGSEAPRPRAGDEDASVSTEDESSSSASS